MGDIDAALGPKESSNSDTASDERPPQAWVHQNQKMPNCPSRPLECVPSGILNYRVFKYFPDLSTS